MNSDDTISAKTCSEIRQRFSRTDGFTPLLDQFDITESQLRRHLYGDCGHDIDEDSVTPAGMNKVSSEECATFRKEATNTATADIADSHGYMRKTIARHAFGRCSHEIETPAADPFECESEQRFSPDECAELRTTYRKSNYETVLDFSAGMEQSYQVILTHLRDRCDHQVDESPVEGVDRAAAVISKERCKEMRSYWRNNLSATFTGVADEFDVSAETAERHIRFLCPHEYESVKADELDIFAGALDTS